MKPTTLGQIGQLLMMITNLFITMLTEKSKKISGIDGNKIQEAIDCENKENFLDELVRWVNNGCRLTYVLANAFTVGHIFRHRVEKGDKRLYLSDNIQNWFVKPFLERVVPVRTELGTLSQYCLPKNMKDPDIQESVGNPGFMDIDTFSNLKYLLIDHPELGKQFLGFTLSKDAWYLFHVELPDGRKVAVRLYWDDDEWRFDARVFDGREWYEGDVLLFFATVEK